MHDPDGLKDALRRIDNASYGAYKRIKGAWRLDDLELRIDHVQGDPYAAPSRVRVLAPTAVDPDSLTDRDTRDATEDFLLRRFGDELDPAGGGRRASTPARRGSGKSGAIEVYRPGPEVVERSALRLHPDGTAEIRLRVGLPARGRRILGRQAWALLAEDLPRAARALLDLHGLDAHVHSVRIQRGLRRQLAEHGLVAFLAEGSVLPRVSGIDDAPLPDAVPVQSPPSLRVSLSTPDGPIEGLGIPEGVTVLIGGGFHGKSTMLQAIQRGHLDHVPGDGRERVVTVSDAVKVRAEDGRSVRSVDISAFLADLPGGTSTAPFSTDDASGSTSQASALVEAIASGARALLLDEDTSATNLLVRDARMRALIPADREPITPLVERVRQLHQDLGISSLLVIGGVGDYLAAADSVILMDSWMPQDATVAARQLLPERPVPPGPLPSPGPRVPLRQGLAPGKLRTRSARRLEYGRQELDLVAVEQILDRAHAATVGEALRFVHEHLADGHRPLSAILDALDAILDDEGVEALSPWDTPTGDLVRPRRHEVAAALNRLRSLQIRGT